MNTASIPPVPPPQKREPAPLTVRALIAALHALPPDSLVVTDDHHVIEAVSVDDATRTPFKVPVVILEAGDHPAVFKRSPAEREARMQQGRARTQQMRAALGLADDHDDDKEDADAE